MGQPLEFHTKNAINKSVQLAAVKRDRGCKRCGATGDLVVVRTKRAAVDGLGNVECRCQRCAGTSKGRETRKKPAGASRTAQTTSKGRTRSQLVTARRLAMGTVESYTRAFCKDGREPQGMALKTLRRAVKAFEDLDRALVIANVKAGLPAERDRADQPHATGRRRPRGVVIEERERAIEEMCLHYLAEQRSGLAREGYHSWFAVAHEFKRLDAELADANRALNLQGGEFKQPRPEWFPRSMRNAA